MKTGGILVSDEYGSDYITITDDEGNEFELEHLDTIEYNNELYMSFLPADLDEQENPEMIILKVIEEDGEEIFSTLDSDEELQNVYEKFMEHLFDEDQEDDMDEYSGISGILPKKKSSGGPALPLDDDPDHLGLEDDDSDYDHECDHDDCD